jgi:hypothetical protein
VLPGSAKIFSTKVTFNFSKFEQNILFRLPPFSNTDKETRGLGQIRIVSSLIHHFSNPRVLNRLEKSKIIPNSTSNRETKQVENWQCKKITTVTAVFDEYWTNTNIFDISTLNWKWISLSEFLSYTNTNIEKFE